MWQKLKRDHHSRCLVGMNLCSAQLLQESPNIPTPGMSHNGMYGSIYLGSYQFTVADNIVGFHLCWRWKQCLKRPLFCLVSVFHVLPYWDSWKKIGQWVKKAEQEVYQVLNYFAYHLIWYKYGSMTDFSLYSKKYTLFFSMYCLWST